MFLITARYRLNTTKYVSKWPKKHNKMPNFNQKKTLSTLSAPPLGLGLKKNNNIHIKEFFYPPGATPPPQ